MEFYQFSKIMSNDDDVISAYQITQKWDSPLKFTIFPNLTNTVLTTWKYNVFSNLYSLMIVMSSVLLKLVSSESAPKRVSAVKTYWVEPVSTLNHNFYSDSNDTMMKASSEPVTLVPSQSAPMI